mmetsp:Transcript_14582/g.20242  ORF Transcript_14582/g.20242 Transcript_14582/m.20242 type:complete len:282 (+) Transcript_14582:234-1079(+)
MPAERIFIINKNSEIKQAGNRSYQQSYPSLLSMADDMFPPSEAKSVLFVDSKKATKQVQAPATTSRAPSSCREQQHCGVGASRKGKPESTTRNYGGEESKGLGKHGSKAKGGSKTTRKNDAEAPVTGGGSGSSSNNFATSSRLVQQPPKRFDELSYWSTPLPDVNDLLSSDDGEEKEGDEKEEGSGDDKKNAGNASSEIVDESHTSNLSGNKKDVRGGEYIAAATAGKTTILPNENDGNVLSSSGDRLPSSRGDRNLDNKDANQNNAAVAIKNVRENLPFV